MTVREIIKESCRIRKCTLSEVAESAGIQKSNLSAALSWKKDDGNTMKVSTLIKLMEAAECQIVVQMYNSDEEFVLDGESELDEDAQAF